MTERRFPPAMRIQIELAILARRSADHNALADEAKRLGLTGAEIEAARRGASFNAMTDVCVKFGLALYDGDEDAVNVLKRKLVSFGAADVIAHVARIVENWRIRPVA